MQETDNLNACYLGLPNLTITKVLTDEEKSSSSTSILCEGTAFDEEVIMKISFEAFYPEYDNSLQLESDVYEKIVPLLSEHTPNLMPFLAKGECGRFITSFTVLSTLMNNKKVIRNFEKEMSGQRLMNNYDLNKLQLVVTKKAKGLKLYEWLMNGELVSDKENLLNFTKDVLLQIAYTLVIFEDFGLMHHDLHAGNVFVEKLPTPLHFSVNIGKKVIVRNINYFVQIYDFDHSAKVGTKFNDIVLHNTLLDNDFCPRFGECNKFFKNMDWFTILQSLHMVYPSLPLISNLVEKKLMKGGYKSLNLAFTGRPCTCPRDLPGCRKCTQIDLDREGLVVSPLLYLLQNYESCTTQCAPTFHRPVTNNKKNFSSSGKLMDSWKKKMGSFMSSRKDTESFEPLITSTEF
jgi:hypothetical protein